MWNPLVRYALIRVGVGIVLAFAVTLVTFGLTKIVPGDPVQVALGEQASANPEIVAKFRAEMGLDKPIPVQYIVYMDHLFHGDLGMSTRTRTPVGQEIGRALPATIELATGAILLAILVGIALGLWSALRRGRVEDHAVRMFSLLGVSAPAFWVALVAYYVFYFRLGVAPGSGRLSPAAVPPPHVTGLYTLDSLLAGQWGTFWDAVSHLIMPSAVLALFAVGLLTRFARSAILEVFNSEYVRAARAKGLSSTRVTLRYILRGSLLPIITVLGIMFASLLSGSVLTETVFSWHGLGELAYLGATTLDLPVVMGVGLTVGIIYIIVNIVIDLIYALVDPRVRKQ